MNFRLRSSRKATRTSQICIFDNEKQFRTLCTCIFFIFERSTDLLVLFSFIFWNQKIAHNISAFKNELGEITRGWNVWLKWSILRLWNLSLKNYFIYDQCFLLRTMRAKRFNFRESLIPLILPQKMLISRIKATFLVLFELLSRFNQMLRPRGEF